MNPEAAIFYKKKALAERLLKIPVEDLKIAPKQSWYGEYLALLAIRLENPLINFLKKDFIEELRGFYEQNLEKSERELALLGMIQFVEPTEIKIPFNMHLWHKRFILDLQSVFLNQFIYPNYSDAEIATYYLARQKNWRPEKRKIRAVFLVHARAVCDKIFPVYEAMKEREDFEAFLVVHSESDFKYNENSRSYFYNRYPNDKIYDYGLMDLRKLNPDYVFLTNPYESRRNFPSFRVNDIVKFAKVCMISYGATLSSAFAERLFDDFPNFYRNIYLFFASAEGVKNILDKKFSQEISAGYKHVEFFGYPILKNYYRPEKKSSAAKNILWAPRWLYDERWGGSHFLEYKNNFIALRGKYGAKIKLTFRPHMRLFRDLISKNLMTEQEVEDYKNFLKENHVIYQADMSDMDKNIRDVDIFICDYSSVMICFFLTGRPIIYCEFPNAKPFPEYEEMFSAMYIARSWKDVENYLDELIKGNDILSEKRSKVAKKIFDTHKDATEKIIGRIVQDFNQSLA